MDTSWCLCSWATHRFDSHCLHIMYYKHYPSSSRVHFPFKDMLVSFIVRESSNVVQHDFKHHVSQANWKSARCMPSQKEWLGISTILLKCRWRSLHKEVYCKNWTVRNMHSDTLSLYWFHIHGWICVDGYGRVLCVCVKSVFNFIQWECVGCLPSLSCEGDFHFSSFLLFQTFSCPFPLQVPHLQQPPLPHFQNHFNYHQLASRLVLLFVVHNAVLMQPNASINRL